MASSGQQLLLARHLLRSDPVPFDGKMRFFDMPKLTYKRGGKSKTYPGYWVMDLEGDDNGPPKVTIGRKDALLFDYDPRTDVAKPWKTPWESTNPIAVLRHDNLVGLSSIEKRHYAVTYLDDFLGLAFFLPLYHPIGSKKGDPMRVTFDDVKSSIFFGSSDGKVFTVRPRLAADSTYLSYLTSIGATP
jgi:hypothetical protein